jgi:hypothetical protein
VSCKRFKIIDVRNESESKFVHVYPLKANGVVEIRLHTFLMRTQGAREWLVSRFGHFIPGTRPRYPFSRRVFVSELVLTHREGKKLLALSQIELRSVDRSLYSVRNIIVPLISGYYKLTRNVNISLPA